MRPKPWDNAPTDYAESVIKHAHRKGNVAKFKRGLSAPKIAAKTPTPIKLQPSDFSNPLFDGQEPAYRRVKNDNHATIEGTTYTNNFRLLCWTYWPKSGAIEFKTTSNALAYSGTIKTIDDFEKAVKRADKRAGVLATMGIDVNHI